MAHDDPALRDRVRTNVGRRAGADPHHPPRSKATPTRFTSSRPPAAPPPGDGGEEPITPPPPPPPPPLPEAPPGLSYCLTLSTAAGGRDIVTTPRIGVAYLLRRLTATGDVAAADAYSFRVLDADDNDTAAVADPTGSDVVQFAGDAVGAEDPGLHAALLVGALLVEPWYARRAAGGYLKLKVHNATAATRIIAVYLDLDELHE